MSFFYGGVFGPNTTNPIDRLIEQYRQLESRPIRNLESQKSTIQRKNQLFSELKTKLNTLYTLVKDYSQTGSSSQFQVKTVTSSNESVVTATADSTATNATYSILVTQLAKQDTVVSSRFTASGTDIVTNEGTGTKTIRITINGSSTDINITINAGDTNETILNQIASAINANVSDATATVIYDTSSTVKLLIKSKTTGSQYAISLQDVTGTLLANIGLDSTVISNRTLATDTTGGYIYSLSQLDATFTLNGINITRGTNTITDVIPGVTLELKGVQNPTDTPVTLTVDTDVNQVVTKIQDFINAYNDVINFINSNSTTSDTGNRAIFSGDFMFRDLKFGLRSRVTEQVTSVPAGYPSFLADIGITINLDGTLTISDQQTLENTIAQDVSKVESLFNTSNGIAVKLESFLAPYVQTGGTIDVRIDVGESTIRRLDEQIARWQNIIDERVENLRRQFAQLQSFYYAFLRQQSMVQQIVGVV